MDSSVKKTGILAAVSELFRNYFTVSEKNFGTKMVHYGIFWSSYIFGKFTIEFQKIYDISHKLI